MEHRQAPEQTEPSVRIAIVDDHPGMLVGLATILGNLPGCEVVLTALSGEQFMERLPAALPVHIAFTDLYMPGMDGFQTIACLREQYPDVLPVAISFNTDDGSILRALGAGACGYLPKTANQHEIAKAVDQLMATGNYRNDMVYECLLRNPDGRTPMERAQAQARAFISERELDVIQVLFTPEEPTTHEVADSLTISPRTVETHVLNLCKKLGLKGRTGVLLWAIRHKFIDPHAQAPPPGRKKP